MVVQIVRQVIQQIDEIAIDAGGHCDQVIAAFLTAGKLQMRSLVTPLNAGDQLTNNSSTALCGHALQITIKTFQSCIAALSRPISAIQRGNALLTGRALNGHIAHVHMNNVRFNAPLYYSSRQIDALGRQDLHQGFRNDSTAMIAPGRAATVE